MLLDFEAYNNAVKDWGTRATLAIQQKGIGLGITHRSYSNSKTESIGAIKARYRIRRGDIDAVIIGNINRSLIFTSAGAGKGQGGLKGSRWVDKYGIRRSTNPASLGKAGTGNRQEKPFIATVLDGPQGVEELGDIVANFQADAVVSSIYLK